MKSMSPIRATALVAFVTLSPMAAAQDAARPAPATPVEHREAVASELARIDAAFRIDGDARQARQDLDAVLADTQIAQLIEGDDALRAARDSLHDRLDEGQAPGDPTMDETVREAARHNDLQTLQQLGQQAVECLIRELTSGQTGDRDQFTLDREVQLLLQLAPEQAVPILRQLVMARRLPGDRLVYVLDRSEVLRNSWSNVPGRQPQLMLPEVGDLLVAGLQKAGPQELDPVWDEVSRLGEAMAEKDAISSELSEALAPILLQSRRREVSQFFSRIDDDIQWPSLQPLYERLLAHSDAYVRADVAERLSRYRDSKALREHVTDTSPHVRIRLAELLRPKDVNTPSWPGRNSSQATRTPTPVAPDDGPEMRSILVTLSKDDDPQVREAAVKSIGALSPPIDRAVLERLAQDSDPGVRAVLAGILHLDDRADAELLEALVSTGDPVLVTPARLHPMLWDVAHEESKAEQVISILRAVPPGDNRDQVVKSIGSVVAEQSARGRNGLTHWALETGEEAPLEAAIDPIGVSDRGAHQSKLVQGWMDLAPEDLARLFPRVAHRNPELFDALWKRVADESRPGLAASMRTLFEDASQPALVRMAAAVAAARELDPALESELLEFVTGPALREIEVHPGVELLQVFGTALPEPGRNHVLLALLADSGPPGGLLSFAIQGYAPYAADGAALTEAILRRWGPSCTGNEWEALHKALEHAGTLRGQLDPQLLIAVTRNPPAAYDAIDAMCRQRDPVFLPTLAECLQAPWLEPESRDDVSDAAASAITAYMSDDAARLLLAGAAATSDSGLRRQCLEGAETIRRFQDSMAAWERRDASRATRDDAVTALVQMADDPAPEVRAEALRGLVSLRADEFLPRIIQGLKDEDAGVRQAAREALDRHHRLEAEQDEQGGADAEGAREERAGAEEPKR